MRKYDPMEQLGNVSLWYTLLSRVRLAPNDTFATYMFGNDLLPSFEFLYKLMRDPARSDADLFIAALKKCKTAAQKRIVMERAPASLKDNESVMARASLAM